MKRTVIAIAIACVLLAGPALAQSLGEKTGVNSALGVAPATAVDSFISIRVRPRKGLAAYQNPHCFVVMM